jgi:hypothetical protein
MNHLWKTSLHLLVNSNLQALVPESLWMQLSSGKKYHISALLDTRFCILLICKNFLHELQQHTLIVYIQTTDEVYYSASSQAVSIASLVKLHVKSSSFSWDFPFSEVEQLPTTKGITEHLFPLTQFTTFLFH